MIVYSSLLSDFRRLGISVGISGLGLSKIERIWQAGGNELLTGKETSTDRIWLVYHTRNKRDGEKDPWSEGEWTQLQEPAKKDHVWWGRRKQNFVPTKYIYILSTTVYVPSSELGLPYPFNRRRLCPPRNQRGGGVHIRLRVRRVWGSPDSDDWRKSYLPTLWVYLWWSVSPSLERTTCSSYEGAGGAAIISLLITFTPRFMHVTKLGLPLRIGLLAGGWVGTMDQISLKTPNPKCRLFLKIDQ